MILKKHPKITGTMSQLRAATWFHRVSTEWRLLKSVLLIVTLVGRSGGGSSETFGNMGKPEHKKHSFLPVYEFVTDDKLRSCKRRKLSVEPPDGNVINLGIYPRT